MKETWEKAFEPLRLKGWGLREPQRKVGQLILDTINKGGVAFGQAGTGVGKSFGCLVPAILSAQDPDLRYRTVISTENINLLNQYYFKDLPMLAEVYGEVDYARLMGRSNYLCMSRLQFSKNIDFDLTQHETVLQTRLSSLGEGDRSSVEEALRYVLSDADWAMMCSESSYCADNCSDPEQCFALKARKKAQKSKIVVTNHALLAADEKVKSMSADPSEAQGILGYFDTLIIDEGHSLESVILSQYTDEVQMWKVRETFKKVSEALYHAQGVSKTAPPIDMGKLEIDFIKCFDTIVEFFMEYRGNESWDYLAEPLCMKSVMMATPELRDVMHRYESDVPLTLEGIALSLNEVSKYLSKLVKDDENTERLSRKAKRVIKTGASRSKDEAKNIITLATALRTEDGIVSHQGLRGINVYGYRDRKDNPRIKVMSEPLDISIKAQRILDVRAVCIISATLADPTDNMSFRYTKRALGLQDKENVRSVIVDSPFDKKNNQLFYLTGGEYAKYPGTQFSHDEALELIKASNGSSLVLFTSMKEMLGFKETLDFEKKQGRFNHSIYMQSKDVDKRILAELFKKDTNSVLLGSSSFMTGFDAAGETLTQVIIPKYTNPRFDTLTKQRMDYWRNMGFPTWYQREGLMSFLQSVGRLLRSDDCYGVISVLDARVANPSKVRDSVKLAMDYLGSDSTSDIEKVRTFYGKHQS